MHLVPTGPEHAPAIQRLAAHPEVAATTLVPHPYPGDGAVRFVEDVVLPGRAEDRLYAFVMIEGDEVVGHISVKSVDRDKAQGEVGYWVGRPFWGRGFATEAVRQIVTFAFEDLGLRRLYAHVLAHNPASGRVLERAGFVAVELAPEEIPQGCASKGDTLGFELVRGREAS